MGRESGHELALSRVNWGEAHLWESGWALLSWLVRLAKVCCMLSEHCLSGVCPDVMSFQSPVNAKTGSDFLLFSAPRSAQMEL